MGAEWALARLRHGEASVFEGTRLAFARWQATSTRLEFAMPRRVTLRVQSPVPLGDVTMVPATLSGQPDSEMARAMAAALAEVEAPTAAEIYRRLRQSFPLAPLSARVAALGVLIGRLRRAF
jgi:hypothetical protein